MLKIFQIDAQYFSAFGLEPKQKLLPDLKLSSLQTAITSLLFLFLRDSGLNSIKRKKIFEIEINKTRNWFYSSLEP